MNNDELKNIIEKHEKWFKSQDGGQRAVLRNTDLTGVDLHGADLRGADLHGAFLWCADLRGAILKYSYLSNAFLHGANLRDADFSYADLRDADMSGVDLYGVNLYKTDLYGANLSNAKNVPFLPMTCPDSGSFTAWKKAHGQIVKLLIPEDARRSSATGRLCRCDRAVVIAIETIDGKPSELTEIASVYDSKFIYKVGEIVEEQNFCEDRFKECAEGIHFFINRQEAVDYGNQWVHDRITHIPTK